MRVGRKRIHIPKQPLPDRVYQKRGKFWFVPKPADVERFGGKTWIDLGADYRQMLIRHSDMTTVGRDTLEAVWRLYQVRTLPSNRESTQKLKAVYWKQLEPVFGHCIPDDIETADIYDYLDARAAAGAPVPANREIALLSHMYTKAIRWRMALRNPCLRAERNPENVKPKRYVTDETLIAWYKFAPRKLALYTELEFMLGQRCSDVLGLRLSQIGDSGIYFEAAKTGKCADFPWTDDLRAVVKELKALRVNKKGIEYVSDRLFVNRSGRPYTKSGFDSIWQREMVKFEEAGNQRFAPSDMRAKHGSDLDEQGGDATRNLQHSNKQITDRHYLRKPQRLVSLPRLKY